MERNGIRMNEKDLQAFLIRNYGHENAACEWKEYKSLKHTLKGDAGRDLISYVSAISNMEGGSIVMGVKDKTLDIVGIQDFHTYTVDNLCLALLDNCANLPTEGLRLEEFKTIDTQKTVWILHVPKHQLRLPVYAHSKAWQRQDEHLIEMTSSRLATILNEVEQRTDWSGELIPEATLADLDEEALVKARFEYKKCHPRLAEEVDKWDNITLLNRAGVAVKGVLTKAAILLLGKEESVHLIRPAVAQITWILMDENDTKIDYEHKSIPFILTVDKILSLIRNLTIREMPGNTLFPDTMKQYDDYSIREALHNCIAHQDYTLQERITLIEQPGSLLFSNGGTFLPQTLENALEQDGPQKYYRNFCLCQGMVNFNMIDIIGRGIKKIFTEQQKRFFPMPDYIINSDKKEVKVRIYGKMIDEKYVELLKQIPDLSLNECIALDCVQKHKPIQADIAKKMKAKGYIEKIKSEWFISEYIARETKQLPDYVKQKGLGRKYYKDMVLRLLSKNKNGLGREDIDNLLLDMVPKFSKNPSSYIGNLLSEMKNKDNTIYLDGNRWKIDEK